MPACWALFIYF